MLPRIASAATLAALVVACSASTEEPADRGVEDTGEATSALSLSTSDAIARAEQWVSVKLHYCQAAYGARDYDSACSTYCNRQSNPAWNPYRSDCSGLISWAWGLPAPGRVTGQFAPFQKDITKVIQATDLQEGDAINNSEHIMLFKEWVVKNKKAVFIEEPGCSSAQPYARETTSAVTINGSSIHVDFNGMDFTAIRYSALAAPKPPAPAPAPSPSEPPAEGTPATPTPATEPSTPASEESSGYRMRSASDDAGGCSVSVLDAATPFSSDVTAFAFGTIALALTRRRRPAFTE